MGTGMRSREAQEAWPPAASRGPSGRLREPFQLQSGEGTLGREGLQGCRRQAVWQGREQGTQAFWGRGASEGALRVKG